MKVTHNFDSNALTIFFKPTDKEYSDIKIDRKSRSKFKMGNKTCRIALPHNFNPKELHPDALALSIILIIDPFVHKELCFDFAVSRKFAKEYRRATRKRISRIDDTIKLRKAPKQSSAALAYSGGNDSTAAYVISPKNTKYIFMNREPLPAS